MAEEETGMPGPAGASLPDKIALGVLTRLVTRELVEDVSPGPGDSAQSRR